ncbi:hypothetical protein L228DRAFT_286070 [Xylona heveae TC161]|uniref:Uncharacterized protein n=1 Tax=Xylona heveae (strain CBS 132557 / TC161) TaxID=1328760 RepID=A0A164ZKP7_XYLHT|nr:hypothetical protein L228DRAFT_286070 [Xylona heveae TC161]KZF19213.1 hypothetical protein L228DRAFT_286070 [Xylona heveae TC161]
MSIFEQNPAIKSALESIDDESYEPPVVTLWTAILSTIFPTSEGFLVEPHNVLGHGSGDTVERSPDVVVVRTEYGPGLQKRPRRDILFVECKRPLDDRPSRWVFHEQQLKDQASRNRNPSGDDDIFTAEAIGWKVKFFRWHGSREEHEPLYPDSEIREPLNLKNSYQGRLAERFLTWMKLSAIE